MPERRHEIGALIVSDEWIDQLPDGLLMCSDDGRITAVNQCLANMAGYRPEELRGQSLEVLVPPAHRAQHSANRRGFVEAQNRIKPTHIGRQRQVRKDQQQQ